MSNTTVLVVDDDPTMLRAVVRVLVDAGANVLAAADGDDAITIATTEPVDLLLTDVEMPGRNGSDVALAVTAVRPEVAIVFMSGWPLDLHVANGRLAAHACLVAKPFAPQLLVATLADALASHRALGMSRASSSC